MWKHSKRKKFCFKQISSTGVKYEGWNFNSGNYLFTTDTK